MKVLYDYQIFQMQYVGGISRYFCELFDNFSDEIQAQVSILINQNLYLKQYKNIQNIPLHLLAKYKGKHTVDKFIDIINMNYSKHIIAKKNYDILHPTYYNPYIFDYKSTKPIIVTIHDMTHEICNQLPETINNKRKQILESDHIIAISNSTKNDILKFYPEVSETKISVVYHGFNYLQSDNLVNQYGKYILFVGRRNGYKNFKIFFLAAVPILKKDYDLRLVCVGSDFSFTEMEMIMSSGVSNKVFQKSVSDEELATLYKFASVFVFPSIYEGFGFPLLEAFSLGCPVCASDASCFPEIAGNAVSYFDPESIESIQDSIEKVLYDNDYKKHLIEKSKSQLTKYSWKECTKNTIATYKKII